MPCSACDPDGPGVRLRAPRIKLADLIHMTPAASIFLLVFGLGLRARVERTTYFIRQPARPLRRFLAISVVGA